LITLIVPALAAVHSSGNSRSVPTAQADPSPWVPTSHYRSQEIQGWTARINRSFLSEKPELASKTLTLLEHQLYQIARRLPEQAVNRLRRVTIWVEEEGPNTRCMAFHPSADWLREHKVNPDKARSVELANARNFLSWTQEQPWMLLHELAHAYHFLFIDKGFDNPEIKAAYEQAMKAKRYDCVLRINGKSVKAYAATNAKEYFAEASEAYFGTNDFYPYVQSELRSHDPELFALLKKFWGGS
jgi:hypothetical protein